MLHKFEILSNKYKKLNNSMFSIQLKSQECIILIENFLPAIFSERKIYKSALLIQESTFKRNLFDRYFTEKIYGSVQST